MAQGYAYEPSSVEAGYGYGGYGGGYESSLAAEGCYGHGCYAATSEEWSGGYGYQYETQTATETVTEHEVSDVAANDDGKS